MATICQQRGVTVVELGKQYDSLDDGATRELGEILSEISETASPPAVVVDMSATEGIGSTFLAVLFSTVKRLRARRGRLAVCNANSFCAEVLEIVKADRVFKVWPSREDAITDVLENVPAPTA
ncbi:MAG: STAS domain-containing protein [Pirellulales bacterium]